MLGCADLQAGGQYFAQAGEGRALASAWDAALLREEPEKALADTLEDLLPRLDALWAAGNHAAALGDPQ